MITIKKVERRAAGRYCEDDECGNYSFCSEYESETEQAARIDKKIKKFIKNLKQGRV